MSCGADPNNLDLGNLNLVSASLVASVITSPVHFSILCTKYGILSRSP